LTILTDGLIAEKLIETERFLMWMRQTDWGCIFRGGWINLRNDRSSTDWPVPVEE